MAFPEMSESSQRVQKLKSSNVSSRDLKNQVMLFPLFKSAPRVEISQSEAHEQSCWEGLACGILLNPPELDGAVAQQCPSVSPIKYDSDAFRKMRY